MITYNAKDLIKRAQQLADLEHSDFISWNENINLLNDAYRHVYQQAIDKGEKFYLQSVQISVPGGSYNAPVQIALPADFYQLESVHEYPTLRPLHRRTVNEPGYNLSYDIVNGTLNIYGGKSMLLEVRYYPLPKTLIYPAPDTVLNFPDGVNSAADMYAEKLVYADGNNVQIFNGRTGATSTIELESAPQKIVAGKNGFVVDGDFYGWNAIALSSIDKLVLDQNKNIMSYNSVSKKLCTASGVEVLDLDADVVTGAYADGVLYYVTTDGDWKDSNGNVYVNGNGAAPNVTYFMEHGGKLFMLIEGNIYTFDLQTSERGLFAEFVCCINKLDDETGYGYTVQDENGYVIKSFVQDTALNYPSNLYFQLISYMLAIAYKAKQNADFTALQALYTQAEQQYYDTLTRDAYEPTRISNNYVWG